jgi:hypothetical protein
MLFDCPATAIVSSSKTPSSYYSLENTEIDDIWNPSRMIKLIRQKKWLFKLNDQAGRDFVATEFQSSEECGSSTPLLLAKEPCLSDEVLFRNPLEHGITKKRNILSSSKKPFSHYPLENIEIDEIRNPSRMIKWIRQHKWLFKLNDQAGRDFVATEFQSSEECGSSTPLLLAKEPCLKDEVLCRNPLEHGLTKKWNKRRPCAEWFVWKRKNMMFGRKSSMIDLVIEESKTEESTSSTCSEAVERNDMRASNFLFPLDGIRERFGASRGLDRCCTYISKCQKKSRKPGSRNQPVNGIAEEVQRGNKEENLCGFPISVCHSRSEWLAERAHAKQSGLHSMEMVFFDTYKEREF